MKKTLFTIASAAALSVFSAYGQGQLIFQNFTSGSVTAQGGGFAGSQFEVSLYWIAGNQVGLGTAGVISGGTYFDASVAMFGSGSLTEVDQSNGAGFFDGGVLNITGTGAGTYTLVAVAYSGSSTYAQALSNPTSWVGASNPFVITLVTGTDQPNVSAIPAFQVAPVPEPSTFALAGLGLASLLIFRRRK